MTFSELANDDTERVAPTETFSQMMNRRQKLIEDALTTTMTAAGSLDSTLQESMSYSLTAGGKRLRPLLVMAAADAVGANGEQFLQTAISLELIHTYSLIHDDLPAMDNDDLRRGKPTNHKIYGDATAILAGDALLTLAFSVLAQEKAGDAVKIAVIGEVAAAAGCAGMVGGQAIDLAVQDKTISLEKLQRLHLGKTGALIRAAVRAGAILGNADEDKLNSLTTFAENYGLAFQITDDILDAVGDESLLGKPTGSDERNHKSTYVSLVGIQKARTLAVEATDRALTALEPLNERAFFLRELARQLPKRQK